MKYNRIFTFAILSIAALSCQPEEEQQYLPVDLQAMTFEASIESVMPLEFSAGDAITVYDGTAARKFTTSTKGFMASFEGEADANAERYCAVYPYTSNERFSGRVQMSIPSSQAAVLNSYDRSVKAAAAVADGGNLQFTNVLSFLKIDFQPEPGVDIVSVTVSSNNKEPLSGSVFVGLFDEPTIEPYSNGYFDNVSISGSKLNGKFYIAVMPQTLSDGYTIAVTNSEDGRYEKKVTGEVKFEMNQIYDLGTVGNVEWEVKPNPNPTQVPNTVLLKASFKNADFNMVSEGGFEDYADKPIMYRTAWIPINGAENNLSYATGSAIEGNATLRFDASPTGGVWLDINQFVAVPMNTDMKMSFTQSVNTPYSRNAFIGEGPNEKWLIEIQGHDMQLWDLSGYHAWTSTELKEYTLEFNTMDYYWGIVVFTIAGDPERYEILDDVKLVPAGYELKSMDTDQVTKVSDIFNATYDEVTSLGNLIAWINEEGTLSVALSEAVIKGADVENTVLPADLETFSLTKFNKFAGKIVPAYHVNDSDVIAIVPDNAFSYNGKSYMHYYAKMTQDAENRDVWTTKYSGFLVSEDCGQTWEAPAHGNVWKVWLEAAGNEMKAPFEWFSEASVCHAEDGYFYMAHSAYGRDWTNYSNFFMSRCEDNKDFTDPANWEHWTGKEWSSDEHMVQSSAMITIGNRSEPCLVYNKKFGRFMLIYRSQRHEGLVFRDAHSVEGPWSGEKIITADDVHGKCIAPSAVRIEDDGSIYILANQIPE